MDSFPIIGALGNERGGGVDFDALERAREFCSSIWRDDIVPGELGTTPQGGVYMVWSKGRAALRVTIDPFSVSEISFDSASSNDNWTRAGTDALVSDVSQLLAGLARSG